MAAILRLLAAITFIFSVSVAAAQIRTPTPAQGRALIPAQSRTAAPAPAQPLRKANDLIRKQEGLKINQGVLKQLTTENTHIVVSIPKQRAYLMMGDQIAVDAPISS